MQEDEPILSPQERRALLEDITQIGLALALAGEPDVGATSNSHLRDAQGSSRLERIRLIAALWPEIEAGLRALLRSPDTRLTPQWREVPLPRSQGGPTLTGDIACRPRSAAVWLASNAQGNANGESGAGTVRERRTASTEATFANRFVVTLLETVCRESRSLSETAIFCGEAELAHAMQETARKAFAARRTPPLAALPLLTQAELVGRLEHDTTLRYRAPYRALWEIWQRLHSPLRCDWATLPWLAFPTREPWRLYEIWCFLRLADALQTSGWQLQNREGIVIVANALRIELAAGRGSRLRFTRCATTPAASYTPAIYFANTHFKAEQGLRPSRLSSRQPSGSDTLELLYQPAFVSANAAKRETDRENSDVEDAEHAQSTKRFVSTSHQMQPDISLTWRGRLYLLDPKYRSYAEPGSEQDDVNKMHTYRDAIVGRSTGANRFAAPPAVAAAWCLFPGETWQVASSADSSPEERAVPLELAVRSYPRSNPKAPFGTAPVGAIRLRPGEADASDYLRRLLAHWFREAGEKASGQK